MMSAIESGETSRVVFGAQNDGKNSIYDLTSEGWAIHNPMDFLSSSYFERWNENDIKN